MNCGKTCSLAVLSLKRQWIHWGSGTAVAIMVTGILGLTGLWLADWIDDSMMGTAVFVFVVTFVVAFAYVLIPMPDDRPMPDRAVLAGLSASIVAVASTVAVVMTDDVLFACIVASTSTGICLLAFGAFYERFIEDPCRRPPPF